jgi:hypothetical protein
MSEGQPIKDVNDAYRAGINIPHAAAAAWQSDGQDYEMGVSPWPELQGPAFRGIAGEIARAASENTEVDPVAVIATTMTFAGAVFGRNRYYNIGDTQHHGRLFTALVGASSKARKGTSLDPVRKIFDRASELLREDSTLPYPAGLPLKIVYGLSSGEGLINAVRDKRGEDDEDWVQDKRLLCIEGEFASVLKMGQRQGNTVGTVLRLAWDGWKLEPLTKNEKLSATEPHICLLGHITKHELKSMLTATDTHNGFVNRFCWFAVRRPKLVAFPKPMADATVVKLATELARAIKAAHSHTGSERELVMSNAAMDFYANVYPELSADHPGLLGAATSRAEPQTLRLATIYAQLDGAKRIELVHLESALALWRYAFDSAAHIFGGAELDPSAERVIESLRTGPKTQSDIMHLFQNNKTASEINDLLGGLQERGRITLRKGSTSKGRPRVGARLNLLRLWGVTDAKP